MLPRVCVIQGNSFKAVFLDMGVQTPCNLCIRHLNPFLSWNIWFVVIKTFYMCCICLLSQTRQLWRNLIWYLSAILIKISVILLLWHTLIVPYIMCLLSVTSSHYSSHIDCFSHFYSSDTYGVERMRKSF